MPPANVDATIIILDIGKNVAGSEKMKGETFFDKAKACVVRIVERKIMSRPKDLIGIILLGSKNSKNNFADVCDNGFRHIEVLASLEQPNWQILRNLPEKPTSHVGDWFDGLIVAADCLKNGIYENHKVSNKKVILMTNFKAMASLEENVEAVLNGFQEEKIEVSVIGTDLAKNTKKGDDIELARHFVEVTEGVATSFEDAMRYLLFHRKKSVTPIPWNVDLSIGPNIKIPVSVYGRIRDDRVIGSWQIAVKDLVTNKASSDVGIIKKKEFFNAENHSSVKVEDTITGYLYGQTVIPFSENDQSMLYDAGQKCLSVYGFTKADNIKWQNLTGNGVSYLFARKGDKNALKAVNALIQCLHELNLVGVARRVYNNGNAPAMHALFPVIDTNGFYCLSVVALSFKDDIKNMVFPPANIKKYEPTDEQVQEFKNLITAMDLTNAYDEGYDDTEAFPIAETVNPSTQYILDCMAYRALNPGKPLPPPSEDIMMIFKRPAMIEKRSEESIEKLKKMLDLKPVVKKPKRTKNQGHGQNDNSDLNIATDVDNNEFSTFYLPSPIKDNLYEDIENISTIDPVHDFKTLLLKGKLIKDLSIEISAIIENLMFINNDYTKALDTMHSFREESVKSTPLHYNEWLQKFKKDLAERNKSEILAMINENKLNIITKEENQISSFSADDMADDEDMLFDNNTIPDSTFLTISSEVNAFLDEM